MLQIMICWKVQDYFGKDFLDNASTSIWALLVSLFVTFCLSTFPLNLAELKSYDKEPRIKSCLEFWNQLTVQYNSYPLSSTSLITPLTFVKSTCWQANRQDKIINKKHPVCQLYQFILNKVLWQGKYWV